MSFRYFRFSNIYVIKGVTITEIAERYNVSRRTAERMRDSLTCIFPQVDEIETDDSQKHWGFINYSISNLILLLLKNLQTLNSVNAERPTKK